jgi:hypothetical protein
LESRNAQIDAALPLRSYLREVLNIQSLRWRFDKKRQHGRCTQSTFARAFAIRNTPCDSTNFEQDGKQFFCFLCLPRVLATWEEHPLGVESNLVFIHVVRHGSGFQRRQPLARFLGSFFVAWQRMNINAAHRAREAGRGHRSKQ